MVAALVASHEHPALARPRLDAQTRVPAIVLAETFAQLRRTSGQPAAIAAALLRPWSTQARMLATTARATASVLARAVELDLGGNIHDALIAKVCVEHSLPLVTLDRPQHAVALMLGAQCTYLPES